MCLQLVLPFVCLSVARMKQDLSAVSGSVETSVVFISSETPLHPEDYSVNRDTCTESNTGTRDAVAAVSVWNGTGQQVVEASVSIARDCTPRSTIGSHQAPLLILALLNCAKVT